jgi:hypothetical protein
VYSLPTVAARARCGEIFDLQEAFLESYCRTAAGQHVEPPLNAFTGKLVDHRYRFRLDDRGNRSAVNP